MPVSTKLYLHPKLHGFPLEISRVCRLWALKTPENSSVSERQIDHKLQADCDHQGTAAKVMLRKHAEADW